MPLVYRLHYAPDIDQNWAVNPGVCGVMSGMAVDRKGNLSTICRNGGGGFTVTGTDALHAEIFQQTSGSVRFLVFRKQSIDEYDSAGTRTNRGSGYNASTVDWDAVAWGNQIIACNYLDATQSSTGGAFSGLGGGAPKARYVAANVNFVMFADVNDGGSNVYSDMVWWSGVRNPNTYTPSQATQAGAIRLLDVPGPITRVVAFGDKFVAFKDGGIFLGQYVGPPYVFSWKLVSLIGCSFPKSVVEVGGRLFFAHRTGVFMFDGTSVENVGYGVWSSIKARYYDGGAYNLRACVDDEDGTVWILTSSQSAGAWRMYAHPFNVNAKAWAFSGHITTSQTIAGGGERPVPVIASNAERISFDAATNTDFVGFLYLDNGATPLLTRVSLATDADGVGSFTTGFIGSNDGHASLTRIYPRIISEVSEPVQTGTVYTYNNERSIAVGAESVASFVWNDVNETIDGTVSGRYIKIAMTFPSQKYVLLAGLGVDAKAAGKR